MSVCYALWSPSGKVLTPLLSFVMSNCDVVGDLGQVWCLIVSIRDICPLSYFVLFKTFKTFGILKCTKENQ